MPWPPPLCVAQGLVCEGMGGGGGEGGGLGGAVSQVSSSCPSGGLRLRGLGEAQPSVLRTAGPKGKPVSVFRGLGRGCGKVPSKMPTAEVEESADGGAGGPTDPQSKRGGELGERGLSGEEDFLPSRGSRV